jgi:hypothetical protein
MRVLVVDVGGTNVKILASGQKAPRKVPSGPKMTPRKMVAAVKTLAADWKYDAVAIGYPGRVHHGRIIVEPHNLGRGWIGFDFRSGTSTRSTSGAWNWARCWRSESSRSSTAVRRRRSITTARRTRSSGAIERPRHKRFS